MPFYIDQTGRTVSIPSYPKRIVSLVPSQTELLYDLGLDEEVTGITKFCIHPESWFRSKTRVGGTKQIKADTIHSLNPDLIIANKEENIKEQIESLEKLYPVWVSDVNNLDEALIMINEIGTITGKQERSKEITAQIQSNFSRLTTPNSRLKTAYLLWQNPYMTAGGDTFIHSMLNTAGFDNLFSNEKRYPKITLELLQVYNCELLLLSSEPYPFKQKHIDEIQALLPNTKILLADGEMFSWYGSRLIHAPQYFKQLIQSI